MIEMTPPVLDLPPGPIDGFSIIIPCYNEADAILPTLDRIKNALGDTAKYEIICIDDGSTDGTRQTLRSCSGTDSSIRLVEHDRNRGYGAALKTGIRNARHELIVITDGDGTYPVDRIPEFVVRLADKDMVVGSRAGADVVYPVLRRLPKVFLRAWASWLADEGIPDINSGLRAFRRGIALRFMRILPDGFSFTTTITIAMLTNHYRVEFVPISYRSRIGRSKIRPVRDTLRFVQLILRTGVYFAPLRVFMPIAFLIGLGFLASLAYDVFWLENITDKTLALLLGAGNTAMFALLADMIDKRMD